MKSVLHFGLMRLEELTEEDNNHDHTHESSMIASLLHHTSTSTSTYTIITLLRYSSHLVFVTGIAVMSAKFWTTIYYVSGMISFCDCVHTPSMPEQSLSSTPVPCHPTPHFLYLPPPSTIRHASTFISTLTLFLNSMFLFSLWHGTFHPPSHALP